jgi:hypothetical protein
MELKLNLVIVLTHGSLHKGFIGLYDTVGMGFKACNFHVKYFSILCIGTASRPVLEPTQLPIQWVPGALVCMYKG